MNSRLPPRWLPEALLSVVAGLIWLAIGWRTGPVLGVIATLPGGLLLGTGVALFLWPGDRQITHYMALGSVLSVPLALLTMPWIGLLPGLLLLILAVPVYITAGRAALLQSGVPAEVPRPEVNARMGAKVAIDEAILGYFLCAARIPDDAGVERDIAELTQWETALEDNGWLESPADFHEQPPPANPDLRERKSMGQSFLHMRFDSRYHPHPDLPGGERWQSHARNRRVHAWLFRHDGPPRPWLIGIHGYRMGLPWMDLTLFDMKLLHHRLGLNVVLPILPLHGPRRSGTLTGGGYLDGPMVDMVHAEAQAAWDLRSVLGWVRESEDAPAVGVLGYSLGGYNTALLASLEPDLDCVLAGIPLTDMAAALWRHMPQLHLRYLESREVTRERLQRALTPVSPLALPPQVVPERRHIFAATGDQIVPPEQPLALWHHWQEPNHLWYHGSHMSVRREAPVAAFIRETLTADGLVVEESTNETESALGE